MNRRQSKHEHAVNNLARQCLVELVAEHGPELADDSRRLEAFLTDYCPECRREIFALVAASRQGVAVELRQHNATIPAELLVPRMAERLEEAYGLSSEGARWAVDSWTFALGIDMAPANPQAASNAITKSAPEPPLGVLFVQEPHHSAPQTSPRQTPADAPLWVTGVTTSANLSSPPQESLTPATQASASPIRGKPPAPLRKSRRTQLFLGLAVLVCIAALGAGAIYAWASADGKGGDIAMSITTASARPTTTTVPHMATTAVSGPGNATEASVPSTAVSIGAPPSSTTPTARTTTTAGKSPPKRTDVQITTYGGVLTLPPSWTVKKAPYVDSDGASWFEAEGASGRFLRCIGEATWTNWHPDPESYQRDRWR